MCFYKAVQNGTFLCREFKSWEGDGCVDYLLLP